MKTQGIKIEYIQQVKQWQISVKNEQGYYNYTGMYGKTLGEAVRQLASNVEYIEIIGEYKNANEG